MIMNTDTTTEPRTLEHILADMRAAYIDAAERIGSSTSPQTILNYLAEAKATSELHSLQLWRQFDDSVISYEEWMAAEGIITTFMQEARKLELLAYALIADIEEGL
jgi:hypothetical protein